MLNEQRATDRLTRILNENFVPDDWWVTLHYEKYNRPKSYAAASAVLQRFIPKLKKLYAENGVELKYVKCTAFGERGGVHHHLVLPQGVSTRLISKLWKEHIKASIEARPPNYTAMYSTGEYSGIAAYIIGQKQYQDGEQEKYVRKWTASRNLKKPKVEPPEEVNQIKWQEPPTPWTGYYIDQDSIRAGCNEVNGRPYLSYRMVKLPQGFTCYDDNGKRLTGKAAVSWYRKNNKEYIKQNWLILNVEGEVIFKEGVRQDE